MEPQTIDYTKFTKKTRKVYNRKILRSMLKHQMKTNKIKQAWKRIQQERRAA